MKKNDIIELKIDGLTSEGSGVGRHEGLAVFVPYSAPGDVIECRILKVMKSYCYGKIERIISPSNTRRKSDCELFGRCGGCDYRHINYEEELRWKERFVADAFSRIGGINVLCEPIISTGFSTRYRNKAEFPISENSGKAVCGFFSPRSHRVVPCEDCLLQPELFSELIKIILDYHNSRGLSCYDEASCKGLLRHIFIRQGYHSKQIMLCLVVTEFTHEYDDLVPILTEKYPDIKSIFLNINSRNTNVILGNRDFLLYGAETITDTICGIETELSLHSFYQVNTAAAELLYCKAAEFADLRGGLLLDLYCGAGTIGLSMAGSASNVIGVEIVPQAVQNARKNAIANGISNADFYVGDAGKIAEMLAEKGLKPDVIVVDPPRKGCDAATLDAILKMKPERLVMISCNPATAARDAKYLGSCYRIERLCAVDMFPRTRHVETVCLLSKINVK